MMSEVNSVATGSSEVGLYYLAAPAAGTFPVQVTLDGSQSMAVGSISFLGTAEAKPLANSGMGNGMSAMSAILTGLGDLVVDVVCTDGTTAPNPAVGQTQRVMKSSGATTADSAIGMSTRPAANGTTTMTWTLNPGAPWALVVAGLAP
jgi:hypothetical protein